MKKGLMIFGIVLLVIGLSFFVSALSLSDLFKNTGKVVTNSNWEITDQTGVCFG